MFVDSPEGLIASLKLPLGLMLVNGIFISTIFSDDLFSIPDFENQDETPIPEVIEEPVKPSKISYDFSGTLDLRAVHTGDEASWTKNGRGLTYYGADDVNNPSSETALKFTRLGVKGEVGYEKATLNVQFQTDDGPDDDRSFGFAEAFLAYKDKLSQDARYSLRAGLVIPPVSLEHPNEVWSTEYTITPSAINSWIGEEVRPLALEFNWTYDVKQFFPLTLTTALFSNNDPAGSILAWRGWSLHDFQWRTDSELPVQQVPNHLVPNSNTVQPFKEIDDRPGYYIGLKYVSPEHYTFAFFHSNSLSRDNIVDGSNEYSWNTRYEQLSFKWIPSNYQKLTFLGQAMSGKTWMGKPEDPGVSVDFRSFYLLGSYRFSKERRLSFRYDNFRVSDQDSQLDVNDSKGEAYTLAYMHPYQQKHLFSVEYIHVDSRRIGNENHPNEDPDDDLFQLAYRFSF